jgi:HD-GYP domain-containing protein (c-di-GMP phosphodiesterase class II)
MSSPPQSDDPSHEAEQAPGDELSAAIVRERGAVLIESLDTHTPGAAIHAEATAAYAFAVANAMELGADRAELVREVAMLHEVGKVYVSAETLSKPQDELDDEERLVLELEAENGAGLARGAGIPNAACEWILRWPERFDGTGPAGIAGESIPLESRIINAACACAEVAGGASPPLPEAPAAVIGRAMGALGGKRLDPTVVEALTKALT